MNETVATGVAAAGPWALALSVVGLVRAQRAWDQWCRTPYPEPRHRRHHRRPPNRPETDHEHNWEYVSPGRRKCYGCGARLAVEVQFHEAPHSTTLGAPTLRGSDVEWAQQFRPDRKGQTDG